VQRENRAVVCLPMKLHQPRDSWVGGSHMADAGVQISVLQQHVRLEHTFRHVYMLSLQRCAQCSGSRALCTALDMITHVQLTAECCSSRAGRAVGWYTHQKPERWSGCESHGRASLLSTTSASSGQRVGMAIAAMTCPSCGRTIQMQCTSPLHHFFGKPMICQQ
jgi:hypothetical protein